jgi:hypothetical protein
LAIQVVSVRPEEGETRGTILHPKDGPWDESTLKIWPTARAIAWPPMLSYKNEGLTLYDLHKRWENPTSEIGGFSSDGVITIPPVTG